MATKRAAPSVHPSRQDQVPQDVVRKRRKPNPHPSSGKSFKKAHPTNDLKSQVRSLKRLLEHNEGLPANVRVEKERALQTTQHELQEAERAQKRSNIIGRYHRIRFFDRQKATKRLKRARKQLKQYAEDDEGRRAELGREVDEAEVDVNYAQYYPLELPYVSLFPSRKKSGEEDGNDEDDDAEGEEEVDKDLESSRDKAGRKGNAEIWEKVKQCMADGTLNALRNGSLTKPEPSHDRERELAASTTSKPKRLPKVQAAAPILNSGTRKQRRSKPESDEESEGGFFE